MINLWTCLKTDLMKPEENPVLLSQRFQYMTVHDAKCGVALTDPARVFVP